MIGHEKEYVAVAKNYGKWSQSGVPHKGWTCIDIEDNGEPTVICEMCESQHIRYIHYMKHQNYKDILGVGCICAGHMEENINHAKKRDGFMKSRANKRKRWIEHRSWKISGKGNEWIKSDGYIVVMKFNNSYWSTLIKSENSDFKIWSRRKYETVNSAKLAAFDYITKLLAENES
jgi:hypothetical protein